MIKAPMLAATVESVNALQFPLLATPKLDGIRCLKLHDGRVVSRSFKPIPNPGVRAFLEERLPEGADGEIWVPGMTFSEIQNVVMNGHTTIDAHYAMFDYVPDQISMPYDLRMQHLRTWHKGQYPEPRITPILPYEVNNVLELEVLEDQFLVAGYEGVMLRTPFGPYKCGRSTLREAYLMKFKRMADSEATIIGMEEKETNTNEREEDAFGRAKRSTKKAGRVAAGTLGSLVVRDTKSGVEFNIGTGFTDSQRQEIWDNRDRLINSPTILTYHYQQVGTKNKPRFPSFKGFRHLDDI